MRKVRYGAITLVLAVSLNAIAAPRERTPREPNIIKKVIRTIKAIVQPHGDLVIPPHP